MSPSSSLLTINKTFLEFDIQTHIAYMKEYIMVVANDIQIFRFLVDVIPLKPITKATQVTHI